MMSALRLVRHQPVGRNKRSAWRGAPRGKSCSASHPPWPVVGCERAKKKPLLAISRFKARSRWAAQCAALIAPIDKKIFRRHSPVHQSTYVENIAGRVDHLSGAPAGSALILWSKDDALCPGAQPEKTTRESSCWLRRGDNCRRGAHRLVAGIADAVELGLNLRPHETRGGPVPRVPRSCARAP